MPKPPAEILKIIKLTSSKFHCLCDSNIGIIRKQNKNVPQYLWDEFEKKPEIKKESKWYNKLIK